MTDTREAELRERVARDIRQHIKCDATGLAPAIASVLLVGIDEAADAAIAAVRAFDREQRESVPVDQVERVATRIEQLICGGIEEGDKPALRYRHEHAKLVSRAAIAELRALDREAGRVTVPRDPTEAMQKAGFLANTFENKDKDGQWGCPGVICPVEPPTDWLDPANADAVESYLAAPKCRIARLTMPANKAWTAMVAAAEQEGQKE